MLLQKWNIIISIVQITNKLIVNQIIDHVALNLMN